MKMASLISFCMSVVILLQVKTLIASESCDPPNCSFEGTTLNPTTCECLLSGLSSTCPTGFEAVQNQNGHCFCRGTTEPQCDNGFSLDPDICQCALFIPPSCPTGSPIHPSDALCVGESVPHCASGDAVLPGCKCETERLRQCTSGTLSNDGCTCDRASKVSPRCSRGCILNSRGCTCVKASEAVMCFTGLYCDREDGFVVGSLSECCAIGIHERSCRTRDGSCVHC